MDYSHREYQRRLKLCKNLKEMWAFQQQWDKEKKDFLNNKNK